MRLFGARIRFDVPTLGEVRGGAAHRASFLSFMLTVLVSNALAWGVGVAYAAGPVIQEFPLPHSSPTLVPLTITAGPDGNLWFTASSNRIGVMTTSGVLKKTITLSSQSSLNAYPKDIVAGPDGSLWFCEGLKGKIGRLTPAGVLTEFATSNPKSAPASITVGPDGALWFTEAGAAKVGRVTTSGALTEFSLPPLVIVPLGITTGPDGNLWLTSGTGIGRMTPGGSYTDFPISVPGAVLSLRFTIISGGDGNLWFTQQVAGPSGLAGEINRITTQGVITTFTVPNFLAEPEDLVLGSDGNIWFTDPGLHKVGRISTSGQIAEYPIPSSLPANVVNPISITSGPDGKLWFTESKLPGIARITPDSGPCIPSATTLCIDDQPNDRRWQLTVTYNTSQGGSRSGNGDAISLNSLGVAQGGLFWFFDPTNPEMLVKVINACGFNQHFWVFSASTTNVGFNLVVRDTRTGISKGYGNGDGHTAAPVQDVTAFACTATDLAGAPPPAPDALLSSAGTELTDVQHPALDGKAACVPSATNLCLGEGRFSIQVAYHTKQGVGISGAGNTLPLQSLGVTKAGLFWFFGANNPELLVKVIDACSFNHQFWVSYAATTNVGFTVTVTDQQTGHKHQYTNSDGTAAAPVLDTAALPCP